MINNKNEIGIFTCIINEIKKINKSYDLFFDCDADKELSGNPIILYNHKVIGINRGWNSDKKLSVATLLQYPIKEFIKKLENKKENNENENCVDIDENAYNGRALSATVACGELGMQYVVRYIYDVDKLYIL